MHAPLQCALMRVVPGKTKALPSATEHTGLPADDDQQLSGMFGGADATENMSLNSNTEHSPRDATAHSTGHITLGYTQILEGGRHPAWGKS